ncbi:MAG: hypothetical protein P8X74_01075 [Reinekea sp.]
MSSLRANQTVFNVDKHWEAIYHSLYPAFSKEDDLYLSLKIRQEKEINNYSVVQILSFLNEIEVIAKELEGNLGPDNFEKLFAQYVVSDLLTLTTKAQFNSPGDIWNKIDFSVNIKAGIWRNEKNGKELAINLKIASEYALVAMTTVSNTNFNFYKKHSNDTRSVLGLSINGKGIFPPHEEDCIKRYSLPSVKKVNGSDSLFHVRIEGEEWGAGNWTETRHALVDSQADMPIIAFFESESGGGGGISSSSDVEVNFDSQLIVTISSDTNNQGDIKTVETTYFYDYTNGMPSPTRIHRKIYGWQWELESETDLNISDHELELLPADDSIVRLLGK